MLFRQCGTGLLQLRQESEPYIDVNNNDALKKVSGTL